MPKLAKRENTVCSFDYETTGVNPYTGAKVFAFCIGHLNGDSEVYRMDTSKHAWGRGLKRLQKFFRDTSIEKVAHNFKFELAFTKKLGIDIPKNTIWHDTMIMHQLLKNDSIRHDLAFLCWKYGRYTYTMSDGEVYKSIDLDSKVKKLGNRLNGFQHIEKRLMHHYQVADAERPLLLFSAFFPEIRKNETLYKDYKNEIELVKIVQTMEEKGLVLDKKQTDKLKNSLEEKLNSLQISNKKLIGKDINLNSPKQLREILYSGMKLPILNYTDNGDPATNKDTIFDLSRLYPDNEFLNNILKYRSWSRGLSAIIGNPQSKSKKIAGYLNMLDKNGVVHSNINTNRAKTGRMSSDNPNLQNVSKEASLKNPYPVPLRKCWRAEKGNVLLLVDYSGIEMRLIINETGEPYLKNLLLNDPNADMHHPTVECFLGINEANRLKDVDKKQYKIHRGAYKNTGFCIAYGGGTAKVALTLGKKIEEIEHGDRAYRERFKHIATFSERMIDEVKSKGFIYTGFERKLYITQDKAYIASNYKIQGTAAQVLKYGMVRANNFLKKEFKNKISFLLPVHDELLISYPRNLLKELYWVVPKIDKHLTTMPEIEIPLRTEWCISSTNWNNKKELNLELYR